MMGGIVDGVPKTVIAHLNHAQDKNAFKGSILFMSCDVTLFPDIFINRACNPAPKQS